MNDQKQKVDGEQEKLSDFVLSMREDSGLDTLGNDSEGYEIPGFGKFRGPARMFNRIEWGFCWQLKSADKQLKFILSEDRTYRIVKMQGFLELEEVASGKI